MSSGAKSSMKRALNAVLLAAGLAAMGSAIAHPGFGGHGGGPGGIGFGPRAEALKSRLNLTAAQEQQWAALVAESQQAREAARSTAQATRQAMRDEMAKADPDLARMAALSDSVRDKMQATRRQIRDRWLELYATFSPEQKSVALAYMQGRRGGGWVEEGRGWGPGGGGWGPGQRHGAPRV
jgi:Spy/CpxP family protein refolding chaperone